MATRLFIEKGYHEVTTSEIAKLANVSVPTLFNYFENKESLVFDEDVEREERLVEAVVSRKKGTSILDSLRDFGMDNPAFNPANRKLVRDFRNLIRSTPELSIYERQISMRYENSLAKVLQKEAKKELGKVEAHAIAHFILDAFYRSSDSPHPKETLDALFKILKSGWSE
ncbi:TetR family transcriptional regulator [Leptospira barantonii]|uniref:TetR family transcriptional regulator n=2 Tax=Leptospira barantonii TaxID=2023184 RepID=A0ABX4NNN9_9LEPT|nr:TetR family transcriptional regulator [Leptospira barantonii]